MRKSKGQVKIEFNLFPSNKKKRELEEKQKLELQEKQRREFEEYTIKQIPHLKWRKTVRISGCVYTSIDNKIMAKSEIISYLDFFISQRSSMSNMEIAISKWETDREFVENYRIGQYTQFGVNAIYRR